MNRTQQKEDLNNCNISEISQLTQEQIVMLQRSDKDIEEGKVVSYKQLDKSDLAWLKRGKLSDEQNAEQ